ncbi:MAG: hypothetical protein CMJ34_06170 [Phycisphaerae bacterium]|nr:hypothetical protein [Phycisphaerae bacterium]
MLTGLLAMPRILLADDAAAPESGLTLLEVVSIASWVLAPLSVLVLVRMRFWSRFVPPAGPLPTPWRLSATMGLGLYLASIFLGAAGAHLAGRLVPEDAGLVLRSAGMMWGMVLGTTVAAFLGALAWTSRRQPEGSGPLVDLRTSMLAACFAAALLIPMVQATSSLGQWLQNLITGAEPSPLGHETLRLMADSTGTPAWWLMATAAVIGAPFIEEVVYRGFLQQSIRKVGLGPIWASILVGGFFALMHVSALPADTRIAGLSGLLVLGVGLGLLREWTGRLDACILVHAIFNVFNLLLAMTVE